MAKTKTKKGVNHPTLVTFLLDRSGSMSFGKAATIEGFNAYTKTLKDEKDAAIDFTFLTFDTGSLDKVYVAEPIANIADLTDATYLPRGGTPLVDAAVKTIRATDDALKLRDRKTKVVIAIQTDGQENSSTEHTTEELRGLIEQKTKDGWEFLFMGAGVDAYSQAKQYGISAANTMSYDHTRRDTTLAAFTASARNTGSFSAGRMASASYTMADRDAAGDPLWNSKTVPSSPAPTIAPSGAAQSRSEARRLDLTKPSASATPPQKPKSVPDISL